MLAGKVGETHQFISQGYVSFRPSEVYCMLHTVYCYTAEYTCTDHFFVSRVKPSKVYCILFMYTTDQSYIQYMNNTVT